MRRMPRRTLAAVLTSALSFSAFATVNTAAILSSTSSPTCLEYKVVGICYWLFCTPYGCKVKTSTKVRHYIPDAVVSAYANTGENPWAEVSAMGSPNAKAQAGNDGTTNHNAENNITKFKEADVIGHPGAVVFGRFASSFGYSPMKIIERGKARSENSRAVYDAAPEQDRLIQLQKPAGKD